MLTCPNCGATLPISSTHCQFCNQNLAQRPKSAGLFAQPAIGPAKWIWPAYFAVASLWVLQGIATVFTALRSEDGTLTGLIGIFGIIVGFGLICKIELVRGIANVLSFVKIAGGALSIATGLIAMGTMGWIGLVFLAFGVMDVVTGGLMVYLIGETD